MIFALANGLVFAGVVILVAALLPVRRLIGRLPAGTLRQRWYAMTALILLFIAGYLVYAVTFWGGHARSLDLVVPSIFFFGACFVWLAAMLSLQTAMDVMRMSMLEREAVTDALTGVFNRRYADRRLREEVASARRYSLPLSVLLLDIDHFKAINDGHGHQAGDEVLRALGETVAGELRAADVMARFGGEEFLIIAPHTPPSGAAELAERVRARVASRVFTLPSDKDRPRELGVTVSIGVATLGDGIDSGEQLIHAADERLYGAKRAGRNRVVDAMSGEPAPPGN